MGQGTNQPGIPGAKSAVVVFGMILLLAAGFTAGCAGPAREPWIGYDFWRSPHETAVGRDVSVILADVDDIADVWVINDLTFKSDYVAPVLRAQWRNMDGFERGSLTRHLDPGNNYLIVTLFNRKYTGPSIYGAAGKYSLSMELFLDGRQLYQKRIYENFNYQKLIFAAVFKVNLGSNGLLAFQAMSPDEKDRLMKFIQTGLARTLHETASNASLNVNDSLFKIILKDPELKPILDEMKKFQQGAQP